MKTTIENINGEERTVVWRDPEAKNLISSDTALWPIEYRADGVGEWFSFYRDHIATALPPLPRNPTPDDATLLYRYMAEGIMLRGKCFDIFGETEDDVLIVPQMDSEITHATHNGQRVEVAITGGGDE